MMDAATDSAAGDFRKGARRLLNATFVVYLCFAGALLAAMVFGLAASPHEVTFRNPRWAILHAKLTKELLVLLFFAATIINLGVRWTAKIVAARRFRQSDPRRAAFAFALGQWISFGVYGLFEVPALYYRFAAAGPRAVLVIATLGALLASLYFLRVPTYLLSTVGGPPGPKPPHRPAEGAR